MSQHLSNANAHPDTHLAFNVDIAAIAIALTFAALVRFNVIHHIAW